MYPGYDHKPALVSGRNSAFSRDVTDHVMDYVTDYVMQMRAYKAADQDGNGFVTRREFRR